MTPLHCDYDDNIFAQLWGRKRIFLAPPHHDAFLYTREANPVLFGSPFDPEAPDYERFPLARQAALLRKQISQRQKQPAFVQVGLDALPGNPAVGEEQLFRRLRGWLDKQAGDK